MAALPLETRDEALEIAASLRAESAKIFEANRRDLARAELEKQPRLSLSVCVLTSPSWRRSGRHRKLLKLPDPLGKTLLKERTGQRLSPS